LIGNIKISLINKKAELHKLQLSKVVLPRARQLKSCEKVVAIHQNVDERVERGREVRIATWMIVDVHPPNEIYARMVIHMQKCDLLVVLSKHHDEGVTKLRYLRKVEQPQNSHHRCVVIRAVQRITEETVPAAKSFGEYSMNHVSTEQHERRIVSKTNIEQIVCFTIAHVKP